MFCQFFYFLLNLKELFKHGDKSYISQRAKAEYKLELTMPYFHGREIQHAATACA